VAGKAGFSSFSEESVKVRKKRLKNRVWGKIEKSQHLASRSKAVERGRLVKMEDQLRGRAVNMSGRSTFKSDYIEQARKLCALGLSDLEIAELFNLSLRKSKSRPI
jgi:hypothetical protein